MKIINYKFFWSSQKKTLSDSIQEIENEETQKHQDILLILGSIFLEHRYYNFVGCIVPDLPETEVLLR